MPFKLLGLFSLSFILFAIGLFSSFSVPPVYSQAANAWNLQKDGSNNLQMFYSTGGQYALFLTPAGQVISGSIQLGADTGVPGGGYSIRKATNLEFRGGTGGYNFINNNNTASLLTILNSGNVGIGTTSPGSIGEGGNPKILQIHNSGTSVVDYGHLILSTASTAAGTYTGIIDFGNTSGTGEKRAAMIVSQLTNTSNVNASGNLQFWTSNGTTPATRMIIQSNGNVGIGTTAPGKRLEVKGSGTDGLRLQRSSSGQDTELTFSNEIQQDKWFIHFNGSSTEQLFVYPGGAGQNLILQADEAGTALGNVGIRTSNPTVDLHIKQSDMSQSGSGGIRLERSDNGTSARIFEGADNNLYLWTNNNSAGVYLRNTDATWQIASDRRKKENISQIGNGALNLISQLKPSKYKYITGTQMTAGFIAQDVLTVFPEAVGQDLDGYYSLNYNYFIPYLTKGMQELNDKVNNQQSEIELLKKEIAELKKLK